MLHRPTRSLLQALQFLVAARFARLRRQLAGTLLRGLARAPAVDRPAGEDPASALLDDWNRLLESTSAPISEDRVARSIMALAGHLSSSQTLTLLRSLMLQQIPRESWALVPALETRQSPVQNTWAYQNDVMSWDIAPGELVLDVGSGGWPFRRADHLADKYPEGTTHRVESLAKDGRPFFEVDIESMPFADRSYDFVFCSHVLEHMDNPGRALRELMRVGRRGYIEVPTRLSDVMFNFTRLPDHHRWHGLVLGSTLVLTEWNDWERRDLGNHYFDALQSPYRNAFQDFFERNRDLFFASLFWNGTIDFRIIDRNGVIIDTSGARQ